eukprot:gene8603-10192_t
MDQRINRGYGVQEVMKDQGDGTHALLVATAGGGGGGGAVTVADGADQAVGAKADAAATSDGGAFSLIALAKRALGNWTTLLARVPALVSGRMPVDGSGVTQPVSAASLPLPTGAATSAAQTTGNNSLSSIDTKLPSQSTGAVPVETIKQALVARQLAAAASSGSSANTALTTTCRRISMYARGADIRYVIGSTGQTATSGSHFIAAGERLDLAVPATPNIAVLGATLTTGTLEVTELS